MGRGDCLPGESAVHVIVCVLVSVFFIIGLPLWLVGCDPDVPNGCITRKIEDANVTAVLVESGACCSSCKCGKSTCCCGGYSCYKTHLGINSKEGYCKADLNGVYHNANDARIAGEVVGNKTTIVIDPRTHVCSIYLRDSLSQWVAGMFFMCLTACCCLCWYIYCCTACIDEGGCRDFYNACDCCDNIDCSCPKFDCCNKEEALEEKSWVGRTNTKFHSTVRQGTVRLLNIRKKNSSAVEDGGTDQNKDNTNPNTFIELPPHSALNLDELDTSGQKRPTTTTTTTTTTSGVPPTVDEDITVVDLGGERTHSSSNNDLDPTTTTFHTTVPSPRYGGGEGRGEGRGETGGGKLDPDAPTFEEIDRKPTAKTE